MLNFDVFRVSSRSFRNNRLRTFLTILGISIGIGTIFFLVALGYGLQKLIIENIASENALLALDITEKSDAIKLNKESLALIEAIPEVELAFPLIVKPASLEKDGLSSGVNLNMVDAGYLDLEGVGIEQGEIFSDNKKEIIISKPVLELLGMSLEDSLGADISVSMKKGENTEDEEEEALLVESYQIKGILKDSVAVVAYIPLQEILNDIGTVNYSKIKIKTTTSDQVSVARNKIIDQGFFVSSISELVEQAKQVFKVINIMLVLFGTVALIVSAIGMFNTMTITLLERTQEIGTMKAIGASKSDIWKMFLTESMLIGLMGGLGGVLTGFLLSKILNFSINIMASRFGGIDVELFYFPTWFVIFIVVFSTVVGIVTGFYPAKRAAKLNALEALRYK